MHETPGHTFQQLTAEELIKSDERRRPDDRPPKRGLGCLTVLGVVMSVLLLVLLANGCVREAEAQDSATPPGRQASQRIEAPEVGVASHCQRDWPGAAMTGFGGSHRRPAQDPRG